MGVHHVEVALVHRHVDGFAHGAAAVVQVRGGVGQFHEVLEVGDGAVAAALLEVVHERRAVGGGEHDVVAADLHRPIRVAGQLGELAWRRGAQSPHHARLEADGDAVDLGAGGLEQGQRLVVAPDLDAHLGEDAVGVCLDHVEAVGRQQLVGRDVAGDERRPVGGPTCPGGGACRTASATPSRCLLLVDRHGSVSLLMGGVMRPLVPPAPGGMLDAAAPLARGSLTRSAVQH